MKAIVLMVVILTASIAARAQDPGWIGVQIDDQRDRGAIVRRVEPNSPAEKAGLRDGDVIVEFNKEQVIGVQQLTRLVRETPVGRTVDIKVRRDNRDEILKVTAERSSPFQLGRNGNGRFQFDVPNVHILADNLSRDFPTFEFSTVQVQSGVRVEQLTDQLRDYFGAPNGGVLVASVDRGSAADKAGLKAGDVITSIDGRTIRNTSDFGREMRANSKPMVKIVRDKQERERRIE